MEYTWILYALGGLLCAGLMDFNKKLVLVRGYSADTYLLASSILFFIIFWSYALLAGNYIFTGESILQGGIYGVTNLLTPLGMITAYKYTSVSFALVTIRLIASFFLLLVGMFFIGDNVSVWNIVGFIFGMFAIFLLSGWKKGETHKIHIKGYLGIILAISSIVFGHTFFKYIVNDVNIPNFIAIQTTSGLIFLFIYLIIRKKIQNISFIDIVKVSKFSLVPAILFPLFLLYFLPNLYTYGPLSLGYKVLSYSIIIPIILSIIFFKEPIDRTRIIAFGLTIASIFLFLV